MPLNPSNKKHEIMWKRSCHERVIVWEWCACGADPAHVLVEKAPLFPVGLPQLLFIPDEEGEFAEGSHHQILRMLAYDTTEALRLTDQHVPRLWERENEWNIRIYQELKMNVWLDFYCGAFISERTFECLGFAYSYAHWVLLSLM